MLSSVQTKIKQGMSHDTFDGTPDIECTMSVTLVTCCLEYTSRMYRLKYQCTVLLFRKKEERKKFSSKLNNNFNLLFVAFYQSRSQNRTKNISSFRSGMQLPL